MILAYIFIFLLKTHAYLVCASLFDETSYVDNYNSFQELALGNKEGVDYQITTLDRMSSVLVLAPHAGTIETGTSIIARKLAGEDFSLYLFEGLTEKGFDLHLTSTKFDEPKALAMVQQSSLGISIHGFNSSRDCVCIGGANKQVAANIAFSLKTLGFEVEFPCQSFKGESPNNIINKTSNGGVQVEISSVLRDRLVSNQDLLNIFTAGIRQSVELPK